MKDGLLDGANGELRTIGDFFGEGRHLGFELVGGKQVIDDAEAMGRGSVNHIAGIKHFRGDRWANELRQKVGAAVIREQTDFGEILAEDGAVHREADIGSERKIHPGAGGRPIDRGDHRLGHGAQIQNRLHSGTQDGGNFGGIATLAAFANRAEIAPGAEGAPRPGQHNDVYR